MYDLMWMQMADGKYTAASRTPKMPDYSMSYACSGWLSADRGCRVGR